MGPVRSAEVDARGNSPSVTMALRPVGCGAIVPRAHEAKLPCRLAHTAAQAAPKKLRNYNLLAQFAWLHPDWLPWTPLGPPLGQPVCHESR